MLQIKGLQSFRTIFSSPTMGYTDYGPYSTVPRRTFHVGAAYAIAESNLIKEYRGFINDGELSYWDDRPVHHHYYDGELIFNSALVPFQTPSYINIRFKASGLQCSCLITPGAVFVDELFEYHPRLSYSKRYANYKAYMDNDQYVLGRWEGDSLLSGKLTWFYGRFSAVTQRYTEALSFSENVSYSSFLSKKCPLLNPYNPLYTSPYKTGLSTNDPEMLKTIDLFSRSAARASKLNFYDASEEQAIWGSLAMDAIESIRFLDTNGIQFFAELLNAKAALRNLVPDSVDLKGLASSYLAKEYGVETQLRDFENYSKAILRATERHRRSTRAVRSKSSRYFDLLGLSVEYHYKVVYGYYPSKFLNFLRRLDEWSLLPNFSMVWDLIPLSFVLDWFADIDQLVDQLDFQTRYQMYDVIGVTRSRKSSRVLQPYEIPKYNGLVSANVRLVIYSREVRKNLDLPVFGYTPPDEFRNITELTALLVANKRK